MIELTQGTIINGVRCSRYPNINCLAIIINARCDLAQRKTNKFYYLISIPLNNWLFSQVGYSDIMKDKINNLAGLLKEDIKKVGLVWDDIKSFHIDDIITVIASEVDSKSQKKLIENFKKYSQYTSNHLTCEEKINIYQSEVKTIQTFLTEVSNGKNNRYILLPNYSLMNNITNEILMVDLQELDYFTLSQMNALKKGEIDCKNIKLSNVLKEKYNEKFFIFNEPGYPEVVGEIKSPWIEYIVQHFANSFIRVGVDNLSKDPILEIVKNIITLEANK